MKYMKDFVAHFSKRHIFSIRDCKIFLKQRKISMSYLHFLIHYLLKSGKLKRITRGVYTFSDNQLAIGFAFPPFYYGLQEALSLHGVWEQETSVVIGAARKARQGVRNVMGANVVVRRIDKKMLFGFEMMNHYGIWIPVSTIEKTLIDLAYFNENVPADTLRTIKQKLKKSVLDGYLKRTTPYIKKKILRYLNQKV